MYFYINFFSFYITIRVVSHSIRPTAPHLPTTLPPIYSLEVVRHPMDSQQCLAHHLKAEPRSCHLYLGWKRHSSKQNRLQNPSSGTRVKSRSYCQWFKRLPHLHNCHQFSKGLVCPIQFPHCQSHVSKLPLPQALSVSVSITVLTPLLLS